MLLAVRLVNCHVIGCKTRKLSCGDPNFQLQLFKFSSGFLWDEGLKFAKVLQSNLGADKNGIRDEKTYLPYTTLCFVEYGR